MDSAFGDLADQRISQSDQNNILRFVWIKSFSAVVGLAFLMTTLSLPAVGVGVIVASTLTDLVFLVPYHHLAQQSHVALGRMTWLSVALSTVSITLAIYLSGDLTQFVAVGYFALIPLALLAVPRPAITWQVLGLVAAASLGLVAAQLTGFAPSTGVISLSLENKFASTFFIGLGLIIEAYFASWTMAEAQKRGNQSERRALAETIWSTVGKTVISTRDLDQILTSVIQIVNEKMQVETGSVLLRETDTDDIIFAKVLKGNIEQFDSVRLKVGQGIVGWVMANGKSAIVQDVSHESRWSPVVDREIGFETHSILCVPLIAQDEIIGAIELLNKQGNTFTDADLQLMESIAAPVAIAIQNARLHQRISTQLEDLTRLFHQVEHAKREWETTVDAIDAGIVMTDEQGRILRANNTISHWLNVPSRALIGKVCWEVIHNTKEPPAFYPQAASANKQAQEMELQDDFLGGSFRASAYPLFDSDGVFVGAVTVLKNITKEKMIQAQLIQSEKMAATGRLAATLAHEINNPLQGIQGCLDLVQVNPEDIRQAQYLAMAKRELGRLNKIVRNTLDFYRPSEGVRSLVDIPSLLDDVSTLLSGTLKRSNVIIETIWAPNLPLISGVVDQFRQVFLNLMLNAIEAMPRGGKLTIQGSITQDAGDWFTLTFTDTGIGIPAKDLPHIFEPFFTRKTQGTGLGLAVTLGIVSNHGGRIMVDTNAGSGATFTILLPVLTNLADFDNVI